jgi:hypothetical protein
MDDRAAIVEATIGYNTTMDERNSELLEEEVFLPR